MIWLCAWVTGHFGGHYYGFHGVHRDYVLGLRNLDGIIFLDFCLEDGLCISNS